jgi:tonB-system energizer ExbB
MRHAATILNRIAGQMQSAGSAGLALLMSSLAARAQSQDAFGVLPHDLTPTGMFMSADIVVKAVMIGLMLASVLTWTILLAKVYELWVVTKPRACSRRAHSRALAASAESPHVALLIVAVNGEFERSPDLRDIDGIKERIAARFERIQAAVGRTMMRATGILATIGATAPFVGLFGAVWGIMNSFIGIEKLHTTNLAVVAPGIAEALLATAIGLAAAIPAVVIYNALARAITRRRKSRCGWSSPGRADWPPISSVSNAIRRTRGRVARRAWPRLPSRSIMRGACLRAASCRAPGRRQLTRRRSTCWRAPSRCRRPPPARQTAHCPLSFRCASSSGDRRKIGLSNAQEIARL